jgi:hypothetical protein
MVERVVHFAPGDFLKDGLAHFGFRSRRGSFYAIAHQGHFLGRVGEDGRLAWTVAARPPVPGVPNIVAPLSYPMYVDELREGTPIVTTFRDARMYRIDLERMTADLMVDGHALGMLDMGNGVVDDLGDVWVNEVTGCRVWQFDETGHSIRVLGNGEPGFDRDPVGFDRVRFGWIYDLRLGPDRRIYVLDSRNFALRAIEPDQHRVVTVAGDGTPGYSGDCGDARQARFGGDPSARFDGPISLALDEAGNAYVGDRHNHVVRMIDRAGSITTIAGRPDADDDQPNDALERDPLRLNLPRISSMDYWRGRLFVPTDLSGGRGDLAVLRRS